MSSFQQSFQFPTSAAIAFGLAFDIERTSDTRSGFKPADVDLGSRQKLFGHLRLAGFAAAWRLGYADSLLLAGGDEGRYARSDNPINRAVAIRRMLVDDYNLPGEVITAVPSRSNTGGNIAIIADRVRSLPNTEMAGAVISSHYHLPRVCIDLRDAGLNLPVYAAEAFWLLEEPTRFAHLAEALGGGPLAERVSLEIKGAADKLRGTYQPRTDTPVR